MSQLPWGIYQVNIITVCFIVVFSNHSPRSGKDWALTNIFNPGTYVMCCPKPGTCIAVVVVLYIYCNSFYIFFVQIRSVFVFINNFTSFNLGSFKFSPIVEDNVVTCRNLIFLNLIKRIPTLFTDVYYFTRCNIRLSEINTSIVLVD